MEAVASNIQKMGEVWATMAAKNKPAKRSATVFKGEEGDDSSCSDIDSPMDHQDEDDVASLLNAAGKQPKAAKSDSAAVLEDVSASFEDEEDTGPNISAKLAEIANKAFSKPLATEKVKRKKELYLRPQNCDKVTVPRVDKEIWRRMRKQNYLKKRDLRFSSIQSAITKSTFAMLSVAENLLSKPAEPSTEQSIRACLDAVFLLGHANTSVSLQRRELLRPVLKSDHAGFCDANIPVTSLLFGDDLPKSVKDIREMDKVGRDAVQPYQPKNWKRPGYNPRHGQGYNSREGHPQDWFNKPGPSGVRRGKKFKKE
ncbi:uncharacterized protein LOC106156643 [Lingula anatina]|uniref:Uncharacterized protein LOC106156643 n=1 Tax=Lingula anatina TaxID=7574 RepID=A0A1S3HPG7_LINAN|nr:uncharacterized protein LOC106156643 [Lingula anatina]|eukprot:XP_013387436.1 uncharacterized protein LOC106156643 [Lingula anatina]